MIEDLVSTALLGTRGAAIRLPPLPDDLANAFSSGRDDHQARLLDASAAATLYCRAGAKPRLGVARPHECPADQWPECSARAADLLAQSFDDGLQPLIVEWLGLAAVSKRRPPHRLMPKLLEAAAAKRTLQPAVGAVIDERGRWLMQFNPQWQFTAPSSETPDEVWQIGTRQQRAEALRAVRIANPDQAREWIAATWKDDAADERAEWVQILLTNLSDLDEEFLESRLDDRSSRVRESAADLLARLPNSRLVQRMIERISPLIAFNRGAAGSVLKLKRATKASLDVKLPDACDKAMQRDGIVEKPSEAEGPKQFWLRQMIGCVPLDYWTKTLGVSAMATVEAAPPDYRAVFLRGWLASLSRRPVVEWIEPLIAVAGSEIRLDAAVLGAVPAARRAGVLSALDRGADRCAVDLPAILDAWQPLSETVSQTIVGSYELRVLLACDAHFYLHPTSLERLAAQLNDWSEAHQRRRRIDQALLAIGLRLELHKEFAG